MNDIQFIKIPVAILKDRRLSSTEKVLLGLVAEMSRERKDGTDGRGLRMSNGSIAEILGVDPTYVSKILIKLEADKRITIDNGQSRYRKIYFGRKSTVKPDSTLENIPKCSAPDSDSTLDCSHSTLEKIPIYFGKKSKHNRSNRKERKGAAVISFDRTTAQFANITEPLIDRWTKTYTDCDVQKEILKAGEWAAAHPQKKDWLRFLTGWFGRAERFNREKVSTGGNGDQTDWGLYDACAQSLTHDADPVELDEIFKGMPL